MGSLGWVEWFVTDGRGDAKVFGVDESADLGEVAVAVDEVVEGGGLHEEGVVAFEHAPHALVLRAHEHGRLLALHEAPHLLVRFDL